MRGRGRDVGREAEHGDEQRDVHDTAADTEEARAEADPDAEQRAEAHACVIAYTPCRRRSTSARSEPVPGSPARGSCRLRASQIASAVRATPIMTSKAGRETLSATNTPSTEPGNVQTANTIPER